MNVNEKQQFRNRYEYKSLKILIAQANQTDFKEKSAKYAGKGLIAESGVEW